MIKSRVSFICVCIYTFRDAYIFVCVYVYAKLLALKLSAPGFF